ncbi:Protein of unknown function DUF1364 [uncultured Caudovirales phage]|uniref:DUF1364 domain-containing protein n=1 Tax=uncultured Caudovirales phage TaxID=2100421 RepID=A0A6J5LKG6_9CAUD|nr:Protein of unknown function DUF1364 [uncultured Caudovirales phage]
MKPSTKPMSRGKPMKTRRKVRAKVDGIDYLALCRGQECFIRLPKFKLHAVETVVPAHSNQSKHGKGMGLKANDKFTVPACFSCHFEIDQGGSMHREQKIDAWDAAYAKWEKYREKLLQGAKNV